MRPPLRATRSYGGPTTNTEPTPPPLAAHSRHYRHGLRTPNGSASATPSRLSSPRITASLFNLPDKKPRRRMTEEQTNTLEALYADNTHPTRDTKQSIGDELGLDVKTITIWLQNKRQTVKKIATTPSAPLKRSASYTAPTKSSRVPRHALARRTSGAAPVDSSTSLSRVSSPSRNTTLKSRRPPNVSSRSEGHVTRRGPLTSLAYERNKPNSKTSALSRFSASSAELADDKISPKRSGRPSLHAQDLWEHMPSSPPGSPDSSTTASARHVLRDSAHIEMPLPTRGRRAIASSPSVPLGRKRTLDWACERQTKLRRASLNHVRSSHGGSSTEEDDEEDREEGDEDERIDTLNAAQTRSRFLASHWNDGGLAMLSYVASCEDALLQFPHTTKEDLSFDVLCGAAMLLDLKYSA